MNCHLFHSGISLSWGRKSTLLTLYPQCLQLIRAAHIAGALNLCVVGLARYGGSGENRNLSLRIQMNLLLKLHLNWYDPLLLLISNRDFNRCRCSPILKTIVHWHHSPQVKTAGAPTSSTRPLKSPSLCSSVHVTPVKQLILHHLSVLFLHPGIDKEILWYWNKVIDLLKREWSWVL